MSPGLQERFTKLTFEGFRELACEEGLSPNERIGFPDSYRIGYETAILRDICSKLTNLSLDHQRVLDIGCGCGRLPVLLSERCLQRDHELILCDSPEMLARIPVLDAVRTLSGRFPVDFATDVEELSGQIDAILCYSVIQYVFVEGSIFDFLDACCQLLAPGGQLLIGDIPNWSKRKRFFSSPAGVRFHQEFTGSEQTPEVTFGQVERSRMDDAVILGLIQRARLAGLDAYLLPQTSDLPMANRREDILIVRP